MPAIHTLPLEELIAKLKTVTRLRLIRDDLTDRLENRNRPVPGVGDGADVVNITEFSVLSFQF